MYVGGWQIAACIWRMDAKRVVGAIDVRWPTYHRTFVGEAGRLDAVVENSRNSKSGPYACATHSRFGEGAPLNSAMILTLDLTEFEMKHSPSALAMISRARSSSASPLTVIWGRTVTSVMRYLPSTFSSRPSASLSYPAGVRPRAWARERNVSMMHVFSEPTSSSSGVQTSTSPLNSDRLPPTMFRFTTAESKPRRAEGQVVLAL